MKFLAALAVILFLNGCATDPEDQNFFYHGWTHPTTEAQDQTFFRDSLLKNR